MDQDAQLELWRISLSDHALKYVEIVAASVYEAIDEIGGYGGPKQNGGVGSGPERMIANYRSMESDGNDLGLEETLTYALACNYSFFVHSGVSCGLTRDLLVEKVTRLVRDLFRRVAGRQDIQGHVSNSTFNSQYLHKNVELVMTGIANEKASGSILIISPEV